MRRVNDFVVGAAVLVIAAVVIGFTMWLNRSGLGGREERLVARFRDVGNVSVGSAVVIRGVQAGRVERVELSRGGWVLMRMHLDPAVELPPQPVALAGASSLFGDWQVAILSRDGLPDNPQIRRQAVEASGVPGVVPGVTLPDIAQLTAVAGRIAGDVASVAGRFEVAFSDTAAAELRASIHNVAELSDVLARTVRVQSRNLGELSAGARVGVERLGESAESFRKVAARLDSSTSAGEAQAIVRDLASAARRMDSTTAELRELTRRLGATQGNLDRLLARSDSVMAKVNGGQGSLGLLVNDSSLYLRSDSALAQLRSLLADIQARPGRYVNVRIF
jgi:phospholipid/cholesterol/gamma-HCH transport system substrate-binding protein